MKYPHPCNQCGYCCLVAACPVEIAIFGPRTNRKSCPALSFDGGKAHCGLVEKLGENQMGIGAGCCIKATAFIGGRPFDFAALPDEIKTRAAQMFRENIGFHVHKNISCTGGANPHNPRN